jgi:hypothetical protein
MRTDATVQQATTEQSVRELRDEIRQNMQREFEAARKEGRMTRREERALTEAERALRNQRREDEAGVPGPPPPPDVPRITIQHDGQAVVVGGSAADQGTTEAPVPPWMMQPQVPQEAVDISIAFFVMIAFIIVGLPLARAFARRMDRKTVQPAAIPTELQEQLRRLETAVDTMAVEIERISEGQRFSSGLLREMHPLLQRSQAAPTVPALGERNANGGGR